MSIRHATFKVRSESEKAHGKRWGNRDTVDYLKNSRELEQKGF